MNLSQIATTVASLLSPGTDAARETAELQSRWLAARDERAVREVETRLFFEPGLLEQVRRAQAGRAPWAARIVAGIALVAVGSALPLQTASALEASQGESIEETESSGETTWDWLLRALFGDEGSTINDDGSEDPEGGGTGTA